MKPKRVERLRRAGIRKGIRASRKQGHALSKQELLGLKIQTMPGAIRAILMAIGIALVIAGALEWPSPSGAIQAIEVIGGILLLTCGIFGIKRTLTELADQMSFQAFEALLDGIFSAIGDSIDL